MTDGLTLGHHHRPHGRDGGAVVVDIHHLDSDDGGATEGRAPPVCGLNHQPAAGRNGVSSGCYGSGYTKIIMTQNVAKYEQCI